MNAVPFRSVQVPVPSKVGNASLGEDLNKPMKDCYKKTRNFLMDSFKLEERETLALMSVGVDFGITEVVDGVWGEPFRRALVALFLLFGLIFEQGLDMTQVVDGVWG